MRWLSRVFIVILLLHSGLFAKPIFVKKALVHQGELQLYFSHSLEKKNITHFTLSNPHREIYDFRNTRLAHSRVPLGLGKNVRVAQYKPDTVRVVISGDKSANHRGYQPFSSDDRFYISLPTQGNVLPAKRYVAPTPKKQSQVTSNTYMKQSTHPNKVVVIDAGHGGHDAGAINAGKREKDLVLQVAKRVERELKKMGYTVYMTRTTDRFLTLPQRTKIADQKNASIFISVHANSVPKSKWSKVQGVETFFLQNTRDARSQRIAERENRAVLKGTNQLSRTVIVDSVLSGPKIVESNKLAIDVQRRIMTNLHTKFNGVKDGGVRHAPFWVLVGASRPSILVEIGYISHPTERKRLFMPRYQDLIAKGIVEGVGSYLSNRQKEIDL
ncbi:MAG: hypothetical protein RL113_191 [Pseudomonadota bacterium]